jgi:thioredoxin-like negative regulator of GroEL
MPAAAPPETNASSEGVSTVTGRDFETLVLNAEGPVAVEFMAYGCVHCRAMEPIMQQLAEMLGSGERLCRVNVGIDQELAASYGIEGTPTFVMFAGGREVGRAEGPKPTVASVLAAVTQPFQS